MVGLKIEHYQYNYKYNQAAREINIKNQTSIKNYFIKMSMTADKVYEGRIYTILVADKKICWLHAKQ